MNNIIEDESERFLRAKNIIERMIAISITNGFDENDPITQKLLEEKNLMKQNNKEIIDKILNEYSIIVNMR